ncbi:MAG TPA: HAD family acid phosphatase [Actinomycetales bacterium]|nr:HAD family acid phosphatase [Actinomycetales bacterium]
MTDAPSPSLPPAVVLDLDGVLADTRHRMHLIERRPKDWDGFFTAAVHDPAHAEGLAIAKSAADQGRVVVYLSGRPERTRRDTVEWLRRQGAPSGELLLRRDDDRRPARMVKIGHLRRLNERFDVQVLVDDDPEVVRAVRNARPRLVDEVMVADWQPRDAAIHRAQEREGRT